MWFLHAYIVQTRLVLLMSVKRLTATKLAAFGVNERFWSIGRRSKLPNPGVLSISNIGVSVETKLR